MSVITRGYVPFISSFLLLQSQHNHQKIPWIPIPKTDPSRPQHSLTSGMLSNLPRTLTSTLRTLGSLDRNWTVGIGHRRMGLYTPKISKNAGILHWKSLKHRKWWWLTAGVWGVQIEKQAKPHGSKSFQPRRAQVQQPLARKDCQYWHLWRFLWICSWWLSHPLKKYPGSMVENKQYVDNMLKPPTKHSFQLKSQLFPKETWTKNKHGHSHEPTEKKRAKLSNGLPLDKYHL